MVFLSHAEDDPFRNSARIGFVEETEFRKIRSKLSLTPGLVEVKNGICKALVTNLGNQSEIIPSNAALANLYPVTFKSDNSVYVINEKNDNSAFSVTDDAENEDLQDSE